MAHDKYMCPVGLGLIFFSWFTRNTVIVKQLKICMSRKLENLCSSFQQVHSCPDICLSQQVHLDSDICLSQQVHSDSDICLSQQVHSDSDIHLDATGSFKRFDPVDRDFRVGITTSSLMTNIGGSPPATASIPPQPLRPAPAPQTSRPAPAPPPVERPPAPADNLTEVPTVSAAIMPADDPDSGEQLPPALQRAMSCDSVCSDTSVVLGDLEEPNVTGYLCVGLEYDRWAQDVLTGTGLEKLHQISVYHSGHIEHSIIVECYALLTGKWLPTFRRTVVSAGSRQKRPCLKEL